MQIIISYHSICARYTRQTIECSHELSHHQLNHKYNITCMGEGWGGVFQARNYYFKKKKKYFQKIWFSFPRFRKQ